MMRMQPVKGNRMRDALAAAGPDGVDGTTLAGIVGVARSCLRRHARMLRARGYPVRHHVVDGVSRYTMSGRSALSVAARRDEIVAIVCAAKHGIRASAVAVAVGLTPKSTYGRLCNLERDGRIRKISGGQEAMWGAPAAAIESDSWADRPMVRRMVPAAEAPPIAPRGPASVWDLAA